MHKSLLSQDFEPTGTAGFLHFERPRAKATENPNQPTSKKLAT
jgi:hypothetical protein